MKSVSDAWGFFKKKVSNYSEQVEAKSNKLLCKSINALAYMLFETVKNNGQRYGYEIFGCIK